MSSNLKSACLPFSGMVYPGVGWYLARSWEDIHKGLLFEVDYLGAPEITFTLNFSKGASCVLGQYYQLLRLGRQGFKYVGRRGRLFSGFPDIHTR